MITWTKIRKVKWKFNLSVKFKIGMSYIKEEISDL